MKKKEKKKSKADSVGGLFFVGMLMIGIGLGFYTGRLVTGTMIGLGVGFIFFGLIKAFMEK